MAQCITTTAPTAGGNLLKFPREIRDQIYKEVFSHTYLVYGNHFWIEDKVHNILPEAELDLSLLATCKVIREEGQLVLYNTAIFRFAIDFEPAQPKSQALPLQMTDRMKQVDFIINMVSYSDWQRNGTGGDFSPEKLLRLHTERTLVQLLDPAIARNTCEIYFWAVESRLEHFTDSLFGEAIQKLTMWNGVAFEIEDVDVSCPFDPSSDDDEVSEIEYQGFHGRDGVEETRPEDDPKASGESEIPGQPNIDHNIDIKITGVCDNFHEMLKRECEPTLGPAKVYGICRDRRIATGIMMEFSPRKYIEEKQKQADAAKKGGKQGGKAERV